MSLSSNIFTVSTELESGVSFYGDYRDMNVSVVYKDYATIVTVFDPSGDNHLTVEYEAFSLPTEAVAEYLVRCVCSSLKYSDRKVSQLIKNLSSANSYSFNRVTHFSHSKQQAREFYNAANE